MVFCSDFYHLKIHAVSAKQTIPLHMVDETVADVDTMGALFPMQFEDKYGEEEEPAVFINLRDPDDELTEMTAADFKTPPKSFHYTRNTELGV